MYVWKKIDIECRKWIFNSDWLNKNKGDGRVVIKKGLFRGGGNGEELVLFLVHFFFLEGRIFPPLLIQVLILCLS